jgi:hypothetical protein
VVERARFRVDARRRVDPAHAVGRGGDDLVGRGAPWNRDRPLLVRTQGQPRRCRPVRDRNVWIAGAAACGQGPGNRRRA